MNPKLKEKIKESITAVLPITGIVLLISVFLVPLELSSIVMFVSGALMLVFGMGFFQLGAEQAMTPIGEGIGTQLSKTKKMPIAILIAFVMGTIITISEPDLQVLAQQVPSIPNKVIILTVAIGVGFFLALAVIRIKYRISLPLVLVVFYLFLIALSFFIPKDFFAVAFDSGGVTTGPITVPFIMALGVGLASTRGDHNASNDSFGLVSLSSIGPILAVLILGCFYDTSETMYVLADNIDKVVTTRDVAKVFMNAIIIYIKEVFFSLVPIVVVFFLFQAFTKRYSKRQKKQIVVGLIYTYIGLVLFLCGVNTGFAPLGSYLGQQLASLSYNWIIVPIGMIIGYFIVKAEPAIQVLNNQVENVTNGTIPSHAMNRCMSIGVSISIGVAMLRVLIRIPLQKIIIPGYIISLILSFFTPRIFVGIAFDSGGVASGPMTSTFLLPFSIGACTALNGNIMTDAFGIVALVALSPIITIQIMGIVYKIKTKMTYSAHCFHSTHSVNNEIINFEEDESDE